MVLIGLLDTERARRQIPIDKMRILFLTGLIIVLGNTGFSSGSNCDSLPDDKKEIVKEIMSKNYLYDCCDETIEKCLGKTPRCKLAVRLANEICSRVSRGHSEEDIVRALSRRAKSMMPSARTVKIDDSSLDTWAGDPESRVTLVAYLCVQCPFCAKIVPEIYREVTEGKLKGKVKFHVRLFPIKSHPHSVEGALALAAAAKVGNFWPYFLKVYQKIKDYQVDKLIPWAKEIGMEETTFKSIINAEETKILVVESKKEGLRNGVNATPSFFINGRKYYADYTLEYFIDVLEEEYDRVTGRLYEQTG